MKHTIEVILNFGDYAKNIPSIESSQFIKITSFYLTLKIPSHH